MGKIWVEVCLISGRGLRRTSSLWKLQWFAVGWIDPANKYCTKIDASGNANPVWNTKFSSLMDTADQGGFQDLALHVEVYSREPIFLRERLLGTATVALKEFLDKYEKNSEVSKPIEEVGSFQLRAKSSGKPQGFVDISIRISAESEEPVSLPGDHEGFKLDSSNGGIITLPNQYGPSQTYYTPQMPPHPYSQKPETHPQPSSHQYAVPYPASYPHPSVAGPSYQPPQQRPPPPPPPPANVGYIPTLLPRTDHNLPPSYISMPSYGAAAPGPGRANNRPGFGAGIGAGALAAGAVIFGDDFMSGFDFPGGLQDASIRISTDPPF